MTGEFYIIMYMKYLPIFENPLNVRFNLPQLNQLLFHFPPFPTPRSSTIVQTFILVSSLKKTYKSLPGPG